MSDVYYEIMKMEYNGLEYTYYRYLTFTDESTMLDYIFNLYKNEYLARNNFRMHSYIKSLFGFQKCIKINGEVYKTEIFNLSFEDLVKKFNWNDKYVQDYSVYKMTLC